MNLESLGAHLQAYLEVHLSDSAVVRNVHGFSHSHGGLTFGFQVHRGSNGLPERFVIRLAPAGVQISGNTDVSRQVPLLRTLRRYGFPVPIIRFAGRDKSWFGTDYVIFEHLPGRAFVVWEPDISFDLSRKKVAPLWKSAVQLLGRVHRFDWTTHLADWEAVTPIENEVTRWDKVLTQAPEVGWIRQGERVRELLLAVPPPSSPVGLLHGDCQPGNILYGENGRVLGLLDWELSCIGSQYCDLGWIIMIGDRKSWHPEWGPVCPLDTQDFVREYWMATGRLCDGISWYQALANYKMAVVVGLFTKLHRNGRRPDPAWEKMALALPNLYKRAETLIS